MSVEQNGMLCAMALVLVVAYVFKVKTFETSRNDILCAAVILGVVGGVNSGWMELRSWLGPANVHNMLFLVGLFLAWCAFHLVKIGWQDYKAHVDRGYEKSYCRSVVSAPIIVVGVFAALCFVAAAIACNSLQ